MSCPYLCRDMPRRFTDDLKVPKHRINGFIVLLKIVETIPFGLSPNFGDAL